MRKHLQHIIKAIQMVSRCSREGFVLKLIYVGILSVLPIVNIWLLKLLIDDVTSGSVDMMQRALPLAVGFCAVFLIQRLVGVLNGVNNDLMTQRLIDYISERLQRQAYRLDMAYYDNPTYHDTFHRAQQEASYRPINLLNHMVGLMGTTISLCGVMVILLKMHAWWIIGVMVLAVVPSFVVRTKKIRSIYHFRRDNTQIYRMTGYYSALLTQRTYAKEVRTFALSDYFRGKFVVVRKQLVDQLLKISRKLGLYDSITAIVETAALAVIIIGLVKGTMTGAMTIGVFVAVFEAFRKGQNYLQSLIEGINGVYENRLFISNVFEFLELKPSIVGPQSPRPFPSKVESVEWRDVTFRYPDMQNDVLSHFSLKASLGSVSRIEGENGFGKSTLLKLLLRLYDPSEGMILINGIDVREFDPIELRRNVGTIFQDYVQFNCTARENIIFGDMRSDPDEQRMLRAARLAGADKVIERLPQGYDTMLGRLFEGGEELSMGQWQRIALARQLYSEAPVLVFDEPMAWMDEPTRRVLMDTLEQLKNEHLIIIIHHI